MTESEQWRPIPGLCGQYEASNLGRVRSRPVHQRGRVLRPAVGGNSPYQKVTLVVAGQRSTRTVHSLVALAWLGEQPLGQEIRHLNGQPADCSVGNLAYGTHSDNQLDTVRYGNHPEANKTHCHRGHEFDEANTLIRRAATGRPKRVCRKCTNDRQRARRATASSSSRQSDHPP